MIEKPKQIDKTLNGLSQNKTGVAYSLSINLIKDAGSFLLTNQQYKMLETLFRSKYFEKLYNDTNSQQRRSQKRKQEYHPISLLSVCFVTMITNRQERKQDIGMLIQQLPQKCH